MQGLRAHTPIVPLLVESLAEEQAFRLVDIGGTGIQGQGWRDFGERLRILSMQNDEGPDAEPPARLVRHALMPEWTWRLPIKEPYADNRMFQMTDPAEPVADWLGRGRAPPEPPAAPAEGLLALIDREGFGAADFLRIDSGAADFANLKELEPLLGRPTLLGIAVRAILSGEAGPEANILANVDALLRRLGFDMFTLDPVRYSSAVLPFPFMNPSQGAAFSGRPLYMRAIYLRRADGLPADGLLKAAALRAMIDLPDQAAEVLTTAAPRLSPPFDLDEALQRLTRQIQENTGLSYPDYASYLAAFEARDPLFYDFRARHGRWLDGLRAHRRDAEKQIAELQDINKDLADRLARAEQRLQAAETPRSDGAV